jgi:hypothetical protein
VPRASKRFGPWVHRTRRSIGQAIENLEGANFLLHWPFVLYDEAFLKYSLGVSREQELSAEALPAATLSTSSPSL